MNPKTSLLNTLKRRYKALKLKSGGGGRWNKLYLLVLEKNRDGKGWDTYIPILYHPLAYFIRSTKSAPSMIVEKINNLGPLLFKLLRAQ